MGVFWWGHTWRHHVFATSGAYVTGRGSFWGRTPFVAGALGLSAAALGARSLEVPFLFRADIVAIAFTFSAAALIRSMSATDVPPNFCTTRVITHYSHANMPPRSAVGCDKSVYGNS